MRRSPVIRLSAFSGHLTHCIKHSLRLAASITFSVGLVAHAEAIEISLQLTESPSIKNKAQGLTEPSGLSMGANGDLWTVSDDTAKLFRLNAGGAIIDSLDVTGAGFEGVAYDAKNSRLIAVKEESNELFIINPGNKQLIERRKLSAVEGFSQAAPYFSQGGANKGLEGIAWNPVDGSFYVIKEGEPGVLIHLSSDLNRVIKTVKLSETGVSDDDTALDDIDYSGLTVIPEHNLLAIVSDKAARVFFYDLQSGQVKGSAELMRPAKAPGKFKAVRKAEGVAYDSKSGTLYVVSDKDAALYAYKLIMQE
ncbi:uncharacterized protein conserved in bacteria [Hahella chejuensis KCTC 2396]|uniref:Uncharacterized protein conserved in bacteria n=1 Tax=Hahella chejuensis (strain KCTC 2396) TaxID=349521 RepID=Q2SNJ6_HAHCH|nr:SdiA-regulated domain-containing protein [Hahella chejuensis]ABC27778.1 uncharacterized protein conserved in bacteria [Hahella chejuensis KCTC 2396]